MVQIDINTKTYLNIMRWLLQCYSSARKAFGQKHLLKTRRDLVGKSDLLLIVPLEKLLAASRLGPAGKYCSPERKMTDRTLEAKRTQILGKAVNLS